MKMKAAFIENPGILNVREVDIPRIEDDDVLIRTKAAGVCGTDVHIYDGTFFAEYPLIPGHEISGDIVEKGKNVVDLEEGDRVAIHPSTYCYFCHFCKSGSFNQCINKKAYGVRLNGGFSEYVRINRKNIYKINNMSYEEGAMIEPLACVIHSLDRAKIKHGDDVLIFGCGTMGLLHLQAARASGAANIVCVDIDARKLEYARKFGADFVFDVKDDIYKSLTNIMPYGFDMVIDDTGNAKVIESMVKYVKSRGTMLFFGVCEDNITINPYEIFKRELNIVGSGSLELKFQESLKMIEKSRIHVSELVTERTDLYDLKQSIIDIRENRSLFKTMLVF